MTGPELSCARSAAVLAHFLDGEPIGSSDLTSLIAHRAECTTCERCLAAARRVDALMASSVECFVALDAADAMLRRAMAPSGDRAPRAARLPRAASAAGLIALGFVLAWWCCGLGAGVTIERNGVVGSAGPGPDSNDDNARETAEGIPVPAIRIGVDWAIASAPYRPGSEPPATARSVRSLAALCERLDLVEGITPLAWLRASMLGIAGLVDPQRAPARLLAHGNAVAAAVRSDAALALVSSSRADASAVVLRLLASWPDGHELVRLATAVRNSPGEVGRLRHRLRVREVTREAMIGAVRVAHADLDEDLRSLARRDPAWISEIVAGVTSIGSRPGAASLFLRMWEDLEARGRMEDEFALASQWFAGLSGTATTDLLTELQRARSDHLRRRCLLALAAVADGRANQSLDSFVDGPRLQLAELAAFALGRAESAVELLEARLASTKRRYLRLAALAAQADARVIPFVDRLRVTPEERRFLLAGRFSLDQFGIAAALFRERAPSGDGF